MIVNGIAGSMSHVAIGAHGRTRLGNIGIDTPLQWRHYVIGVVVSRYA